MDCPGQLFSSRHAHRQQPDVNEDRDNSATKRKTDETIHDMANVRQIANVGLVLIDHKGVLNRLRHPIAARLIPGAPV